MTSLRELVEAATPGPWTWGPGAGLTVEDEATHHLIALVPELAAVALAAEALEDSFRVGGTVWLVHQDALRDALAALRARLNPEEK